MLRIIDTSFYSYDACNDLSALIKLHETSQGYIEHMKGLADVQVIKQLNCEGTETVNGIKYAGFKSRSGFGHIPFKTIRYIKNEEPDIVIVQGLIFPLQVIWLRRKLGKGPVILVQHHGERPFKGIKGWLQKKADRSIDGYLFTSIENAGEWIGRHIIANENKCFELLEASTHFKRLDKLQCKQKVGLEGDHNFLWVGRLNAGKDPLTVVKAFEKYCAGNPGAKLFMIYQTEELLPEIKKWIEQNEVLAQRIILKGRVPHEELETWFSAVDFYISGSHREGSGYALLEAMACGCIPVVTDIPSFTKITGSYGFLFPPGNVNALLEVLERSNSIDRHKMSSEILSYFQKDLSFKAIADDLYSICQKLKTK